eukprot:TRINITY_DN76321_c0_g1_i1.p1 TRINITY_DN76321_c0_g1~~TRINITY_DN76321_c0_g1_i1.p1  ORF type:complete len:555 (-),score=50.29 TRINITY_DN76321_c0_g1_i1:405-2069(-)
MPWTILDGDTGSTVAVSSDADSTIPAASDPGYAAWAKAKVERSKLRNQPIDASKIIVDVPNVIHYRHSGSSGPSDGNDWELLRAIAKYYGQRQVDLFGVLPPYLESIMPSDIQDLFADIVPSSQDDETIIQLAREDNWPFLTNDKFEDWAAQNASIYNFVKAAQGRLHVHFSFSKAGRFVPSLDVSTLSELNTANENCPRAAGRSTDVESDLPAAAEGQQSARRRWSDGWRHSSSRDWWEGWRDWSNWSGSDTWESRWQGNDEAEETHTWPPQPWRPTVSGGRREEPWIRPEEATRTRPEQDGKQRHVLGSTKMCFHVPHLGWDSEERHMEEFRSQLREHRLVIVNYETLTRQINQLPLVAVPEEGETMCWDADEVAPLGLRWIEIEGPANRLQALLKGRIQVLITQPHGSPLKLKFVPHKTPVNRPARGTRLAATPRFGATDTEQHGHLMLMDGDRHAEASQQGGASVEWSARAPSHSTSARLASETASASSAVRAAHVQADQLQATPAQARTRSATPSLPREYLGARDPSSARSLSMRSSSSSVSVPAEKRL